MTLDILPTNPQNNLHSRTFDSGEIISLESNLYWLLEQGIVKTYTWTEEGQLVTLGYWGANDLIGQSLSLVYPYQVMCLTLVRASSISVERSAQIVSSIRHQVQQTEELLYIMRSAGVCERLRQVLLWLARKFGRSLEIGRIIEVRLTHQDLADLTGATRVTVTKTIKQLEKEGFLSRPQRNTIIIHKS